ncbi:MAG TPA: methionine--tRNA ligase subunit beta, partial [Acidobacteriaceae bacterium]
SKSKGNIVRTETILEAFGEHVYAKQFPESTKRERDLFATDVLRYFLLREIPFGQDGSFSFDALVTRYNADLANGYGNLVSRTLAMIERYFGGALPDRISKESLTMIMAPLYTQESEEGEFDSNLNRALDEIFLGCITDTDRFVTASAPWKVAASKTEQSRDQLAGILYSAAEAIRMITALLYPVLPYSTARVWGQLGLGDIELAAKSGELNNLEWGGLKPGTKLGPLAPIFPRAPKELADIMADIEEKNATATQSSQPAAEPATQAVPQNDPNPPGGAPALVPPSEETAKPQPIGIDDFAKIELRVAQILVAERIPKADKLLRLEVDLGYEKRQILSGIAEWYAPEDLIGRRIIVITNLAPRKMRGLESHGMLLAGSENESSKPILATMADDVPLGTRLK